MSDYCSEHGQDRWLDENVFRGKRGGVFAEIGALDGILHSNSLFFESVLGWTGICVEANPDSYTQLRLNRPGPCLHAAVAPFRGVARFRKFSGGLFGWSGLEQFIEPQHEARIDARIPPVAQTVVEVPCVMLQDVLPTGPVDYVSLDIEGAEFEVLKHFPFHEFRVEIFDVENNFNNHPIGDLMRANGYRQIARLGVNDIFRRVP